MLTPVSRDAVVFSDFCFLRNHSSQNCSDGCKRVTRVASEVKSGIFQPVPYYRDGKVLRISGVEDAAYRISEASSLRVNGRRKVVNLLPELGSFLIGKHVDRGEDELLKFGNLDVHLLTGFQQLAKLSELRKQKLVCNPSPVITGSEYRQ